ncbi:MAG TPA: hypothetical protein VF473_08585 [Cyclobacteriaceae bacterium]
MRWSRLVFRDKIAVNAEYAEMATFFKKRIGENYFKGYIDEHQSELYCYWPLAPIKLGPIPICQMNFDDKKDADGNIAVHFKIMNSLTVFTVIIAGAIAYELLVTDAPVGFAISILVFPYLYLLFRYDHDHSELVSDLKNIESRHSQQLR